MSALTGEWECALHEEFSKEYYKNLFFFMFITLRFYLGVFL